MSFERLAPIGVCVGSWVFVVILAGCAYDLYRGRPFRQRIKGMQQKDMVFVFCIMSLSPVLDH